EALPAGSWAGVRVFGPDVLQKTAGARPARRPAGRAAARDRAARDDEDGGAHAAGAQGAGFLGAAHDPSAGGRREEAYPCGGEAFTRPVRRVPVLHGRRVRAWSGGDGADLTW